MTKSFYLYILKFWLIFLAKCELITDLMEGTIFTESTWLKSSDLTGFIGIYTCDETLVGPFLGPISQNIIKTYTTLYPHYEISISMDILITSYWNDPSNYIQVNIDSNQVYIGHSFTSSTFTTPQAYCKDNVIANQNILTFYNTINHSNTLVELEILSTFQSSSYLGTPYPELLAIKNVIIKTKQCHQTCATCSGPSDTECLTCTSGTFNLGQCTCLSGYYFQYNCVPTCPIYYIQSGTQCILECSLYCLTCSSGKCTSCESGYKNYLGQCVLTCPYNSSDQGSICKDQSENYSNSLYLAKLITTLDSDFYIDVNKFTFTSYTTPQLSIQTNQKYSIYNNQIYLGGFGVWSEGSFKIVFSSLPTHTLVKFKFDIWYIDNWNNCYTFNLDGNEKSSGCFFLSQPSTNQMYRDNNDLFYTVDLNLVHTANTMTVEFKSQLTCSPFEASFSISNFYAFIDISGCPSDCSTCTGTSCTVCDSGFTLINGYCTSVCDSSIFRNNDCSCQNGYYDNSNYLECQICSTKCSTCTSYTICTACAIGSHLTLSSQCTTCDSGYTLSGATCIIGCSAIDYRNLDCSCLDGYYDDGINQTCQQCRVECQLCSDYTSCQSCNISQNFIILPFCMNCVDGYFYSSGTCNSCDSTCKTCFGSNYDNCISCYTNYGLNLTLNTCQICQSNQFVNSFLECQDCDQKCNTCTDQTICTICGVNRVNPPLCECDSGYFLNSLNECQACNYKCLTCETSATNCITCAGNRLYQSCQCEVDSQEIQGSAWCENCQTAILNINFSQDLNYIEIAFNTQLVKVKSSCSQLFQYNTLNILGDNPICLIKAQTIEIIIGINATITQGSQIIFLSNILKFKNCNEYIMKFINNFVQYMQQEPIPQIILQYNQVYLNSNSSNDFMLYIIQQKLNGVEKLNYIEWSLISYLTEDEKINSFIEYLNNQVTTFNNENYFLFPQNYLQNGNILTLKLTFNNFLQYIGSVLIDVYQNNEEIQIDINFQSTPYYLSQPISISYYLFNKSYSLNETLKYNITNKISNINYENEIILNTQQILNIPPKSFQIGQYQLIVIIKNQNVIILQRFLNLIIIADIPIFNLQTGTLFLGFKQDIIVTAEIFDSQCSISWECYNLNTNDFCMNQTNQTYLTFSQNKNLSISSPIFTPIFTPGDIVLINAYCNNINKSIQISIVDSFVPIMNTYIRPSIPTLLGGYLNYQDIIQLNFTYSQIIQNDDKLQFQAQLVNDNQIVKLFQFYSSNLQFRLSDYFTLREITNKIKLQIKIQDSDYFMPSTLDYEIIVNLPPLCSISNNPQVGISFQTKFNISITNCDDNNLPLQYNLILYNNQQDYTFDQLQGSITKGFSIIDFQSINTMETMLSGEGEVYLLVQVKDAYNSTSNYSTNINLTQNSTKNSDISLFNLSELLLYTLDISQFESNQQSSYFDLIYQQIQTLSNQNDSISMQQQFINIKIICGKYYQFDTQFINTELIAISKRLSVIKQLLQNQQFITFSKSDSQYYNHNKSILYQESMKLITYISVLFQNSNLLNKGRRLLEEQELVQTNNHIVIDSVNTMSDISLINQVLNSDKNIIINDSFNITTQMQSQQLLSTTINAVVTQNSSYYIYKNISYISNPFIYDSDFQELSTDSNYQTYYNQILDENNSNITLSPETPVNYTFSNSDKNENVQCAVKLEDMWSLNACETKQESQQVTCQCESISIITLINALENMVDDGLVLFTSSAFNSIFECNYFLMLFFYILIFYTLGFCTLICIGKRLDQYRKRNLILNTKVAPWDSERGNKQKDSDDNDNVIEQDNVDSRANKQKSIFSSVNKQIQEEWKSLKESTRSQNNLKLTTNQPTCLRLEYSDPPQLKNENVESLKSLSLIGTPIELKQNQTQSNSPGLVDRIQQHTLTMLQAYWQFVKINHKLLSIYYLYDNNNPRLYRATVSYISTLGEISIFIFFGSIIDLNTIIALSLFQTLFGIIFRKIMLILILQQNRIVNYLGFNIAFYCICLFIYIILVSIASKYGSPSICAIWGAAYLSSFFLENVIYQQLFSLLLFILIKYFYQNGKFKKLLKYILNENIYQEIYGDEQ